MIDETIVSAIRHYGNRREFNIFESIGELKASVEGENSLTSEV